MQPGDRFGRLVAVERAPKAGDRITRWRFLCDCGNTKTIVVQSVRNGDARSCGCLRAELSAARTTARITHGRTKSPEYSSWLAMRKRCYDPNNIGYKDYGGRGIKVCDRWLDSFENFFADMGERPPGTSIDRIGNSGNYEPGNCRWATSIEQNSNTRNTRNLTHDGKTMSLKAWARTIGLSSTALDGRLKKGWGIARALSVPPDKSKISRWPRPTG